MNPITRTALTATALLTAAAGPTTGPATQPATQPAVRSIDAILRDMTAAKGELQAAIGQPADMRSPERRAALAPKAIPALHRLIADVDDFERSTGRPSAANSAFGLQLRAICSALGDRESTDRLAAMAADSRPAESVRGQVGQLVSQWVQVPGDGPGQLKVADQMAALAAAHPADGELAYFVALMTSSAADATVRDRLLAALDGMTSPTAVTLRGRLATTGPAAAKRP